MVHLVDLNMYDMTAHVESNNDLSSMINRRAVSLSIMGSRFRSSDTRAATLIYYTDTIGCRKMSTYIVTARLRTLMDNHNQFKYCRALQYIYRTLASLSDIYFKLVCSSMYGTFGTKIMNQNHRSFDYDMSKLSALKVLRKKGWKK